MNTIAERTAGLPGRRIVAAVLEAAGATLLVAALEGVASAGDLRVLYLLAVLFVAVRRSQAVAMRERPCRIVIETTPPGERHLRAVPDLPDRVPALRRPLKGRGRSLP